MRQHLAWLLVLALMAPLAAHGQEVKHVDPVVVTATPVATPAEQLGASVKAQWAVLGRFDFVSIVEAPDESTMARVSLELGSRGTGRFETLSAIPIDDFIASL